MRTEVRFLLAVGLMLLVLVGTNLLFPPVPPQGTPAVDSLAVETPGSERADSTWPLPSAPSGEGARGAADTTQAPTAPSPETLPERIVRVESPLYRYDFSTRGARLVSAELPTFRSLRTEGPVQLLRPGGAALGHRIVVGADTLDLSDLPFEVDPQGGLAVGEGSGARLLTFTYRQPSGSFAFELEYSFLPDSYLVDAVARIQGVPRGALVLTGLGHGLDFTEADSASEARMMAYVGNHLEEGVRSEALSDVETVRLEEGPFLWAAFKSKFFVLALLAGGEGEQGDYLGGLLVRPEQSVEGAAVEVAQSVSNDGDFDFRLFMGPQEYARLSSLGSDLEEVNPYGWRFFRPILLPIVALIMAALSFLHNSLSVGYGWVLVLFGVLMRVVLWPFNQKAMRAQMRNMAVQPLVKEIQTKYKDNPEKLQKEMLRLYKEYGFNPLAGCLPMLLPFPVLIALFFVFQNTIEFRGVPFLWMPDLSAPDPFYILPVFLAASMWVLQYMSMRSMDQDNPQMKMMLWFMPIFLGFLFLNFAAGLNLYYATSNVATLPQQYWISKERKKAQGKAPLKLEEQE